ncbi:WD40-repeat-containing domain [Pseudocohnilembus persalinus]|uniref:WD40-repeat-containing domain n=1 Tax=Pseudocohnilembus persalinus TaxID=266149 RepID=A0A0V0QUM9_PSEPJ|nr:WD40-repeat-containing domain [Pseudocohnilembus persalinus]|eukprot:KRX05918.1 WD40-repeat-containing domain [Pseudocohnilembus persalinus]
MSVLKEVHNGGIVAWNFQDKSQHLFATASISDNNEQGNILQIFKFDNLDKSKTPIQLAQIELSGPCNSMTWSTFGVDQGFPQGLIILGMQNSSVLLIDANQAIESQGAHAIIHEETEMFDNLTPIETLQYNPLKPNLIAIGGEYVFIMDIQLVDGAIDPNFFQPDISNNPHENSTVTAVSWNQKIPHILASASQNGITVIWDLKTNKPIKSFGGNASGELQNVSLAWSPDIPTCLAKSDEQQKSLEIQLWDLRNPKGPVMILEKGHNMHISCISWCTQDPQLLLSGSHDCKVICWNVKNQEQISIEQFDEPIKNVQWSLIKNLYAVTLQSGRVLLKSLHNDDSSIAPPLWYTPLVGASFSANGDLAFFHQKFRNQIRIMNNAANEENQQQSDCQIQEFLDLDEFFEQLSANDNISDVCQWKQKRFQLDTNATFIWNLLDGISQGNSEKLIEILGFDLENIQKKAEIYTGRSHRKVVEEQTPTNIKSHSTFKEQITEMNEEDAMNFFDNMAQESNKVSEPIKDPRQSGNFQRLASSTQGEEIYAQETISKNINWDAGIEKIIKQNLVISNYEGAIDVAMKLGRQAEALLIAYSQGKEIFEQTMKDYFVSNTDVFVKNVIRNVVYKNNTELVQSYQLASWKECVGILLSSVGYESDEFKSLLNDLGDRFIQEKKDEKSAIYCYILGNNFNKITEIYYKNILSLRYGSLNRKTLITNYLQILVVLNRILNTQYQSNIQFNKMIYEISRYLFDENLIIATYSVLLEGDHDRPEISFFKDQLFQSNTLLLSGFYDAPQVPYTVRPPKANIHQHQNIKSGNQFGHGGNKPVGNQFNQFNNQKKANMPQPPINKFNDNNAKNPFNQQKNPVSEMNQPPINNNKNQVNNFNTGPFNQQGQNSNSNFSTAATNNNPFNPNNTQNLNSSQGTKSYAPPPVAKKEKTPSQKAKYVPPPVLDKGNAKPKNPFQNQAQNPNQQQQKQINQQQQVNQAFNPNLNSSLNQSHNDSFYQQQNKQQHPNPPNNPVKHNFAPPPVNQNRAQPPVARPPQNQGNKGGNLPPPPMKR